jgi:hypothetical protein
MNKGTSIPSEHEPSHIMDSQACHEISKLSSTSVKLVGSIENFWWSYAAVRKELFDRCLQDVWNKVFSDTVTDYFLSWRKRKLWSPPKLQSSVNESKDYVEKMKSKAVSTGRLLT